MGLDLSKAKGEAKLELLHFVGAQHRDGFRAAA
jgi:hypothetical protein